MLLTLDIGNTNIKSALFDNDHLIDFKTHSEVKSATEYLKQKDYSETAICSVNPGKEKIIIDEISKRKISIFRASIDEKINLKIKYKTPETLGMDRVCSAAGAYELALKRKLLNGQYLLTIDFGTATTINVVSPDGAFIGGLISPGIKTMLNSLKEQTAKLPVPDLVSFESVIGDSTNSSILSGVYTATTGMINEIVNHLTELSKRAEPIIFVTGGNSRVILPFIKHKVYFEEVLVLLGLKTIYDLNN